MRWRKAMLILCYVQFEAVILTSSIVYVTEKDGNQGWWHRGLSSKGKDDNCANCCQLWGVAEIKLNSFNLITQVTETANYHIGLQFQHYGWFTAGFWSFMADYARFHNLWSLARDLIRNIACVRNIKYLRNKRLRTLVVKSFTNYSTL